MDARAYLVKLRLGDRLRRVLFSPDRLCDFFIHPTGTGTLENHFAAMASATAG